MATKARFWLARFWNALYFAALGADSVAPGPPIPLNGSIAKNVLLSGATNLVTQMIGSTDLATALIGSTDKNDILSGISITTTTFKGTIP